MIRTAGKAVSGAVNGAEVSINQGAVHWFVAEIGSATPGEAVLARQPQAIGAEGVVGGRFAVTDQRLADGGIAGKHAGGRDAGAIGGLNPERDQGGVGLLG